MSDKKTLQLMSELLDIMTKLRSEEGCPWDREQDHKTLRKYVIEEAYEVVDAIDKDDPELLAEELGDLLLQVVFHSEVGKSNGTFDMNDVVTAINQKMIRRHPHVFGNAIANTASDVMVNWIKIKATEKHSPKRLLDVPLSFPALYRSQKIQKKAASVGFDWDDESFVRDKIIEEFHEVETAINESSNIKEELGDLLFSVVNWTRMLGYDAEETLREANEKFIERFYHMEDIALEDGKHLQDMALDEQDRYWEKAKIFMQKAGK